LNTEPRMLPWLPPEPFFALAGEVTTAAYKAALTTINNRACMINTDG
jgi:hypothetical protein